MFCLASYNKICYNNDEFEVINMKNVKYFLLTLLIASAFLFSGCVVTDSNPDDNTGTKHPQTIILSTPENLRVVEYDNRPIIFFDIVEDAMAYELSIYKNNKLVQMPLSVTPDDALKGVILNDLVVGTYEVSVRAIADKSKAQLDSEPSKRLSFDVVAGGGISDIKYNVVFDSNGGSFVTTKVVSSGEKVSEPAQPTRKDYEFVEWRYNGVAYDFNTPVTGNITLVAEWKESKGSGEETTLIAYYQSILDGNGHLPTGTDLKLKLRTLISSNVKSTSYDQLRNDTNGLGYTDADPDYAGNLILFYSRASVSAKWDGGNTWNREHVWPKSLGWYSNSGAGADIHHIRPADNRVNSTRGNMIMGEVTGGKTILYNGSPAGNYANNYYEPLDEVKGDVARIYMYMMVRYSQTDSQYPVTRAIQSMSLLLQWHLQDPVDEFEKVRNERSYQVQGNRNPFIDNPEFAEMIWG